MRSDNRSVTMARPSRGKVALSGAVALLLLAAACGDSTDDETATPASTTATTAAGQVSDVGEYCDKTLEIETAPQPEIDFETATPEEIAEATKQAASEVYLPLAQEIQAVAPEEIADDVDILVAAVEEVTETGDFEATFEAPEVEAASDRTHGFDLANCGWGQADVTAVEYEFQGIDATYEPGPVSFELANEGGELHELTVFKKNEGVTESFEDILGGPEEEAMGKVTPAAMTFVEPGEDAYAVADLEAGEYIAVCFIPVGLTPELAGAAEEGGEEPDLGPPHFTQGMQTEFTVE
jgi:hypothetical protein